MGAGHYDNDLVCLITHLKTQCKEYKFMSPSGDYK